MSPPSVPPISPYGIFSGNLFQYKSVPSLVAFESSPSSKNKCILIGGLSDGLIPTPYTKDLETACHELGWSLVQPMISSSGLGFGHGSLSRDTYELGDLMNYLMHHSSAENFALVGHSTGCQNSVHFMKYGNKDLMKKVKLVALQAPVSDREEAMNGPNYKSNIEHARKLKTLGQEDDMMPRSAFWAPITAARFLSLQDIGGDDDYFSSDLNDEELAIRLRHLGQHGEQIGMKTLVAFSNCDEYVPSSVDKKLLLDRLCAAMRGSTTAEKNDQCNKKEWIFPLMIETGNHNLSKGEGDKEIFVKEVKNLLREALS